MNNIINWFFDQIIYLLSYHFEYYLILIEQFDILNKKIVFSNRFKLISITSIKKEENK